jgi:23S rRNA (adenine2503-C2)-methyltransferase
MTKIPILSHTHQSYSHKILELFGKGFQLAGILYQEFFRNGRVHLAHPAFKNAQALLQNMLEATDFSLLENSGSHSDGQTAKFLTKTADGLEVESVLIPMQAGGTLCISSQVGCRMGCVFCETGRMGLLRHLTAQEIVGQVFKARHVHGAQIRNIVFMGMGEPLDNYEAVMQAVRVLADPKGFGFGKKHITISTSGCVDGIEKLMQEGAFIPNLAVSINAPNDYLRTKLMPVNRKYDLQRLYQTMKMYGDHTGREILVAYVLLKEVNDSVENADELADYLQGLKVKVNLIPYNPQTNDRFARPEDTVVQVFMQRLRDRGCYPLLRRTQGKDIMAACGQLGNVLLRQQIRNRKQACTSG